MDYQAYTLVQLRTEFGQCYFIRVLEIYCWQAKLKEADFARDYRIAFLSEQLKSALDFKLVWATQDVYIYRHRNVVGIRIKGQGRDKIPANE